MKKNLFFRNKRIGLSNYYKQTCDALKNSARMEISMKKKKIKNPLIRRIPRELTGDWKKYLVVSLFLILMIGFDFFLFHTNLHSCAVFKRITSLCGAQILRVKNVFFTLSPFLRRLQRILCLCASTAPYHSRSAAEILCSLISL